MREIRWTILISVVSILMITLFVAMIIFVAKLRRAKLLEQLEKNKTLEQHRVSLMMSELSVQQQTMQFIGREIHDSVAQKLTLASIYSQKIEFENQYPALNAKIQIITSILNAALLEMRDLSKTLTNPQLNELSLKDLVENECQRINDSGTCKIIVNSDFNEAISITVKAFVYRVLQEFIQNSLKHGECTLIHIDLVSVDGGIKVVADDNGKGFNINKSLDVGMGLSNMERRISAIGGNYSINSTIGIGTSIEIYINKENLRHD